jgi:SAM-dependent methyltransferase
MHSTDNAREPSTRAPVLNLLGHVHDGYISSRRIRVLSSHLAELIPPHARVLDVGSGDGLLAHAIQQRRADVELRGIDVLLRSHTYIPVEAFDGTRIPYGDGSFDIVMMVDVLHHAQEPRLLLQEAVRVARQALLIKDHLLEGILAGPTLRLMDWIGNARHGVALPFNYWTRQQWFEALDALGLKRSIWEDQLRLYIWPARWIFERSLHFLARLDLRVSPPFAEPHGSANRREAGNLS